ncbi:cytochrome P450 [Spongisporangium articulatum]|uniref:Cytochrome P450 n=1 Tax=Spongisporangium articulatum TaxID=3362603 RepID=A0ABW8AND5_9ACTN
MSAVDVAPVRWDAGTGAFVVTGFEEASAVLRGSGWSSDPANSPLAPPEATEVPSTLMLFRDPPDHTRLRRLVAPSFTARSIEALRPRVAAVVEACLDELDALVADGEEVDLLADFGYLVPMAVIAELLDVGVDGAEVFLEQTPRLVKLLEIDAGPDDLSEAVAAALEVTMFLTPVLAQRRAAGPEGTVGTDFISSLLATDLSLDEVLGTCVLLLAAGHETTANLIANGAQTLMEHPDQVTHLHADPARAVEELLRLHGPVKLIGRTALGDQTVGGVQVPAGSQVLLLVDAAGRDPRRWPDPDRVDLTRNGPAGLGFGAGIHFCLGAALARLEAAEALTRFFARFPGAQRRDPSPRWRASSTFHGLEALPVRLPVHL